MKLETPSAEISTGNLKRAKKVLNIYVFVTYKPRTHSGDIPLRFRALTASGGPPDIVTSNFKA